MDFKVGDTHRALLQGAKPYKIYIMAIVDDEYIAFKWYGRHKQWWHYGIEQEGVLGFKIERASDMNR